MNDNQLDEIFGQLDKQNERIMRYVNRGFFLLWITVTVIGVVTAIALVQANSTTPTPSPRSEPTLRNIPGVKGVAVASAVDTAPAPKSAVAACPIGQVILSGGYILTPADPHLRVLHSAPDGNAWTVVAVADTDTPDELAWGVTATAICAGP